MYIPDEEYYELKKQLQALNEKIEYVKKPTSFASVVEIKPYGYISSVDFYTPVFAPRADCSNEVWKLFIQLGKSIHQSASYFKPDLPTKWNSRAYIRKISNKKVPKTLAEMSAEQIKLSAEMITEMIGIYNRYFQKVNTHVLFDEHRTGEYSPVVIMYPEELNEQYCQLEGK